MKKFTLVFLALVLLMGASYAQNADKKWAIGLGPGIYNNLELKEIAFMPEFYLSRYLSPSFDLMLKTEAGFNDDGTDLINPLLNMRFKFFNGSIMSETSAVQPYLFGGVGYLWDNLETGVNFDAGVGSKFPLSPNTSLYLEAGYINGIDGTRNVKGKATTVNDNFLKIAGIIEFAFGAQKDSDGDGVKDKKDECPDTPPGVKVDEKGCPLDRDGDGVPDYKDDCPDTPGEAQFNGCPDKDGDGIPDIKDDCPDVAGLAKFKGCPDTDEDGVPDPKDKCAATPKGCPVDADGCPLDSDGDGVIDCQDRCPTVAGSVNNEGCPDWQTLEIPTIYFDFDKATLKEEAKAELDKLVETLDASKEFDLVIGGHTCNIGTEKYNMGLSEKRAQAVVKYLLMKGVNNAYVGSHNYGEDKPAVPNTSIKNRKLNRRAEFEVAKVRK
ncbi:MAG: OmpA family protein [Prolixibacteraceae bacterium]|nr:OmpA family protein [Prolixibacteraceae bacterium]